MSTQPFHRVNVFTGVKGARIIAKDSQDVLRFANFIKNAKRPLLVLGAKVSDTGGLDKPIVEYALEIAKADTLPICATAHSKKSLVERGVFPESSYDLIEILNHLKNEDWKGVRGEGNHDLVIFLGIRSDLLEQGLSTLRHFAPHLKTMTLDNYVHPHATYSLPNFIKVHKWNEFLENIIDALKGLGKEEGQRD